MGNILEKAEALKKCGKKVLALRIKQKYFDEIMSGSKTQEFREIRPTNEKKYIYLDEEGYAVEDKDRPVYFYDYIPTVITEKDGKRFADTGDDEEEWTEIKTDDKGDYVEVENTEGGINQIAVILDKNGNPHFAVVDEILYCSVPKKYDYIYFYIGNEPNCNKAIVEVKDCRTQLFVDEDKDRKTGFMMSKPVWYEYGKDEDGTPLRYFVEQVVYDLGEIIEKV